MSQSQTLTLYGVLSETKRIINAHSRHFLSLSVLFLLPLSFSLILYPSLSQSHPTSNPSLFFFSATPNPHDPIDQNTPLLIPSLYALSVTLISLFATASITHSTFHGFYGRPVKFVSSIKSIIFSILPLIVTQMILGLIVSAIGGFVFLVYKGLIAVFNIEIEYNNVYFLSFSVLIGAVLVCLLVYLQVEWCLSSVVVVVESKWGFSPLKRSSYLIKGMRRVAFFMIVLFGFFLGFLGALCSSLVPNVGGIKEGWVSWAFIFQTVVYTGFMTILMLYSVASSAVLYMYCKALHGELAFEIAEEFAQEYVSLPFDDGKVPHVVYVA